MASRSRKKPTEGTPYRLDRYGHRQEITEQDLTKATEQPALPALPASTD